MRRLLPVAALLALGGCVKDIARNRVHDALVEAGIDEARAGCMAQHMTDKLTIAQLEQLKSLKGAGHDPVALAIAVRRIRDKDVIKVTLAAAALCYSGLEH